MVAMEEEVARFASRLRATRIRWQLFGTRGNTVRPQVETVKVAVEMGVPEEISALMFR